MDTHQLKAFVAVAELESVSRAAERLFLTQPAVTRRLQILEEQLGQPLFDRLGRHLMLTEAGRCLLPYARQILDLMDKSAQAVADLAATVQGTLTLVTSHHIGLHRLPLVLREYKRLYPEVTLKLRFMNSQEAHRAVRLGEADLGVTTEEDPISAGIVAETIWLDRLEMVVAPDHPLAAQARALQLEDLSPYPALLPDARFYTGRIVRELFQNRGVPLNIDADLSTDYLETLKALVAVGSSWSVLPATMLHDDALKILDVKDVHLERHLVAIRHAHRSLSRAAEAFAELLRQQRD
jgi:DNA-binding transcriptional LysR family regulator